MLVINLLAGCRVIWVDKTLDEKTETVMSKGKEEIKIEATLQSDQTRLIFRGNANLPQGAVLVAELKEYPDGVEQTEVLNGEVQPVDETALEKEAEMNEDGSFLIVMDRPDTEKRYQAAIRFAPEIQPEEIQQKFGKMGELIGESDGLYQYEADGTTVTGIAKYAPVFSLSDGGWYRGKFDMFPNIEDARPSH
ncbi:hypothetical protein [Bacillus salacetis]|uniref:hypothetical protein n=1 Tax=Bacillus salacetis TaxID=2315464 RepID=UPI0014442D47|nr:hypothetical protein [Bacillus salacetis]